MSPSSPLPHDDDHDQKYLLSSLSILSISIKTRSNVTNIFAIIMIIITIMIIYFMNHLVIAAPSSPSYLSKFAPCANTTYHCIESSKQQQKRQQRTSNSEFLLHCCCYELWSSCRRTLHCDETINQFSNSKNISILNNKNNKQQQKMSNLSCQFLLKQDRIFTANNFIRKKKQLQLQKQCKKQKCSYNGSMRHFGGHHIMILLLFILSLLLL